MDEKSKQIEFRSIAELHVSEVKDENNSKIIEGKAIVYNSPTILYTDRFGNEYREIISSEALNDVDLSDVPLKYNHSQEKAMILARARQKTLILDNRQDGLYFKAELRTNLGEDIYESIKAGDITGCSFGFIINEDEFDNDTNTRTVKKIYKLTDISVVDEPAYKQTFVEARSTDYFKQKENELVKALNKREKEKLYLLSLL